MTNNAKSCVLLLLLSTAIFMTTSEGQTIRYHGGATLPTPINVYLVWYGNWNTADTQSIRALGEQFVRDLGNSRYAHTNDTYSGNPVTGVFTFAGSVIDQYSQGAQTLTERTTYDIVMYNWGWVTSDPYALFFVLASADLNASYSDTGNNPAYYGTGFCGWHGSVRYFQQHNNPAFDSTLANVRFGFVESPEHFNRCIPQYSPDVTYQGPNNLVPPNNRLGDGMVSHLGHELLETANDPDHEAWFVDFAIPQPDESADLCAYHFQPYLTRSDGANYNLSLNGHYYLVQQEWVNLNSGYCAMISSPATPTPVYPSNGLLHAPANFQVRWIDGLGGTPADPNHPITYAINYKYWSYGGVEPGSYTRITAPCSPDGSGVCNTTVTGEPDGFYRWYVEANLDTSAPPHTTPSVITTSSSVATFTVGNDPIGTISPPLSPDPIYPYNGLQGVAPSFVVQWNDGLDAARRSLSQFFPVTYAIYYEYWPFGGVEPQSYTLVTATQPCNSVYVGICQTYVTGEANGNWRWYVIANMDVSGLTGVANSILSKQSNIASFTVGYPPAFQGCYTDDTNRALPAQLMSSNATVESCTQAAFNAGYRYAGLQWYGQCFAGNTLGYSLDAPGQCNTPCTANGNEMCGGAWHNSIWTTGR